MSDENVEEAVEVAQEIPAELEPVPEPEAAPVRRGMSLRLRIFIILSAGAHFMFLASWGVPAYVKYRAEIAAIEEAKRLEVARKEAEKMARENDKRQKIEATKKEVEDVLKEDFDKIVQADMKKDEKDKIWNDVVKGMDEKLENYAKELASATASDAQLDSELTDMKGAMVTELDKELRNTAVKDMADDFINAIDKDVIPKLAADYKKNIAQAVGAPLAQQGAAIVRDEKTMVERERADIKSNLDTAVKDAERARDDLAAAKDRIKNAQETGGQAVKDAREREGTMVKGEEPGIEQAQSQIKSAVEGLAKAAEKAGNNDIKDKIAAATKNEGAAAAKAAGDAQASAEKGDGKATQANAAAAAGDAKKLGDAIGQISSAIDAGPGDANAKKAAKDDIAAAKKQADAAANGLKGTADRIGKAENATAAAEKTSGTQTGRLAGNEAKSIGQAEGELKNADAKLGKAAEKAGAFGDDLQKSISGAASNEGKDAEAKVGAAKKAAADGKLDEMGADVGAASDAAKKLADAAGAARDAADKAQFDPAGLARAVMKGLEGSEIKGQMDNAFAKDFAENTAPRLSKKLGDAFQSSLSQDGIQDDATVAEVRAKINDLLKKKVPGLAQAGDAATDALDKTENLGGANDGDKKNDARVKAVTDKVRKAVAGLADKGMSDVAGDAREDDAALGVANADLAAEHGPGGHHGKHGKGGADAGAAAGAGGDGNDNGGDGASGGSLAALLARVQNLAKNVKAGRMGFLEGGDGADGADGGDGAGIAGGKKGAGGAAGGAGAAGGGMGLGGPDGKGGPGGVAGLRQHALNRNSGGQRGGSGSLYFNKDEHAKLTDGIHDRDQNAVQGDVVERKGATGEVSLAEAIKDRISSGVVMVPAPPTGEAVGLPAKNEPYKPKFKTINFAAIPYLPAPMKIDGDAAKWKDIPALPIKNQHLDGGNRENLKRVDTQTCKIAWDNTGLYFFYDMIDADNKITKVKPNDFWGGDGVEIFFDARNTKDKSRGSAWTQQFWVWPFGMDGDDNVVGGEAILEPGKDIREPVFTSAEIQRAAKKTADGWTMEVHLPFERLKNFNGQPGRIFGLNLSICTGTDLYYYWAGTSAVRTSEKPDTWGDVLLAGSDGKLEVIDKLATELKPGETAKPVTSIEIGAPLKIRVTDADMNLSDKRRDKLAVTVKSKGSGQARVVTLEETGEKTGVFEGSVGTDLNLGDTNDKTVMLFEGETIDVIYLDQARANGARNVEVKLPIKTAAAVFQIAGAK